jgi:hypothetical protein
LENQGNIHSGKLGIFLIRVYFTHELLSLGIAIFEIESSLEIRKSPPFVDGTIFLYNNKDYLLRSRFSNLSCYPVLKENEDGQRSKFLIWQPGKWVFNIFP